MAKDDGVMESGNSTSSSDEDASLEMVELRDKPQADGTEKVKERRKKKRYRYCQSIGPDGSVILLALFMISGAQLYIAYVYTSWFQSFRRPLIFFFLAMAFAYLLLPLKYLCKWRKMVRKIARKDNKAKARESSSSKSGRKKPRGSIQRLNKWRRKFKVGGSYYLWKLYMVEIFGSAYMFGNFMTIFLCSLPELANILLCMIYLTEQILRIYNITRINTTARRNCLLRYDTAIDLIDLVLPLLLLYSVGVTIPIAEVFQVTLLPSLTTGRKLRSLYVQTIRKHQSEEEKKELRKSDKMLRYTSSRMSVMARAQDDRIPKPFRAFVIAFSVAYSGFLLTIVFQLLVGAEKARADCGESALGDIVWDKCKVRVPLCGNILKSSCNCAVLQINGHNMSALPQVIDDMTGLRRVEITDGPLRTLSDDFGAKANKLSFLQFSFNKLNRLPRSVESMEGLHTVYVDFNEIEHVPPKFWSLPELHSLDFSTNKLGATFDEATLELPNLHYMFLSNNSISKIPDGLNSRNSPSLILFSVDGNNLNNLANFDDFQSLNGIWLARNNFTGLPLAIKSLVALRSLDVRNNSIPKLPCWLGGMEFLMDSNRGNVFAAGNPLCPQDDWVDACSADQREAIRNGLDKHEAGCTPQCSIYCTLTELDNHGCDNPCNSEICSFDKGKCR